MGKLRLGNIVKKITNAPKKVVQEIAKDSKKLETHVQNSLVKSAKKIGGSVKKIGALEKKAIKKVTGVLKAISQKGLASIEYAPLLPFYGGMVLMLDKKGVSHTGKIEDVAQKFYSTFIDANYETNEIGHYINTEYFENNEETQTDALPSDATEQITTGIGGTAGGVAGEVAAGAVGVPPPIGAAVGKVGGKMAGGIVAKIIEFFKNTLSGKKGNLGQDVKNQINGDMKDLGTDATKVLGQIAGTDAMATSGGMASDFKQYLPMIGIGIGVLIVAFILYKVVTKK